MLTVDTASGMAREIGELWRGEAENGEECIVNVEMQDDDVIMISTGDGKEFISICIPAERIRKLLNMK